MESDSTNLRCIIEEEEEDIEPSTVRYDKMPWKQDLRSIQEMEDKENIPEYPEHISNISVSDIRASQSKRTKKKGFNLRKSLAWNPAFFTEEGVLEPAELSHICGSVEESNRSTKSSKRHVLNEAVKNSYSKSQMKSELRSHAGRKLFITPEPPRRQEKKAPEATRKLKRSESFTKTLLRPPTTSQQKRVANPSATGNVPKVQKFIQGSTTPTSRVSSNKENVARAGENCNGPRCIPSVHEKEPLFPPKSSTGAESSAAMNSQTIPKAPINAPLTIKPSALRRPSPSFGFFTQGNAAAESEKSKEKTLTGMPSSLPKPPLSKWRPHIGHDTSTKLTAGTFLQSKIPQRMRFDRPMVNPTATKHIKKSKKSSMEPREKLVASLGCISTKRDELQTTQHTSNSILMDACSSIDENAVVTKSDDAGSNGDTNGVKHIEEENRICGGEETVTTLVTQNSVLSKKCSLMDVDVDVDVDAVISKPNDVDSKVNTNGMKHTQQEEAVVTPSTCHRITPETCSSKDKHTTQGDFVKVSISPVRTQRGKTDYPPCKEKSLEKRFELDSGSSITSREKESFEDEKPEAGKVEEKGAEESSEPKIIPKIQTDLVPFSLSHMDVDVVINKSNDVESKVDTIGMKHTRYSDIVCEGQEKAVVTSFTCNHIPPETCSSKDKNTTRQKPSVAKVSISPLRTQRGKSDFSPCKEKSLEKRFKLDSGSSLAIREKESFEDEKPEAGKVEETGSEESSKGRTIPKFQTDLVPFSEEWLAALEAYGEEILEKKTGPVQNSPPDKTAPEPSPWSPVKRKAQDIGPYDCTKYSKTTPPSDAE